MVSLVTWKLMSMLGGGGWPYMVYNGNVQTIKKFEDPFKRIRGKMSCFLKPSLLEKLMLSHNLMTWCKELQ